MKWLGLVSILIVVAAAALLLTRPVTAPTATSDSSATYGDALESAQEAVERLGDRAPISNPVAVYDDITVAADTRTLDLSGRGLTGSLKAEIRLLTELEVLDISNNEFTGLPAEVGQLSKLRVLNLSNNPFTGLPHELGNLQNLETLDLRGTQYADFDLNSIRERLPTDTTILTD